MKYPKKLSEGDTVGLVAPSSSISTERIAQCIAAVQNLGYRVKVSDNLDANYHGVSAGDALTRAKCFNEMFADRDVDAVWCVRGGDGSSRIMEYLDYDLIRENPKVFIGYSDITNIHIALTQRCGIVTFHGPMVSSNVIDYFDEEAKASFYAAINSDSFFQFFNPKGKEINVIKAGKAEGAMIGGNLSLLSASIGTPYEIDTENKVLFIEEVEEPTTKIEKWMYHLRNSGKLGVAKGIVLGQFTNMSANGEPDYDAVACITDICSDLEIPIISNVQSGHDNPMMTLPMGARCTIDTADKTLIFEVER